MSQTIGPGCLNGRCRKKLGGRERERRRAQAAETNGCQICPEQALGYPHGEVKSIVDMIQIHILGWHVFFPYAEEALATVVIKSFTNGADAKHLKGFAILWCIWSKKPKESYANTLLCVLFFGIYLFLHLRCILQLLGAEFELKNRKRLSILHEITSK